ETGRSKCDERADFERNLRRWTSLSYSPGVRRPFAMVLVGLTLAGSARADHAADEVTATLLAGEESFELAALRAFDESLFGPAPARVTDFPSGSRATRARSSPLPPRRDATSPSFATSSSPTCPSAGTSAWCAISRASTGRLAARR